MKKYKKLIILIIFSVFILTIACESDEDLSSNSSFNSNTMSSSNKPELSGTIEIDGSSTVFPISVAAAEIFREEYSKVQIPVGISGTGGGMKRFVIGETTITNASRPIKDKEVEIAKENGIEFTELTVAFDGLSVIVNKNNDWVDCLTTDELNLIWDQGSTVNNWNQVRPSFPDKEISLYGPGTDSGTFDYFTEVINGKEGKTRADFTPSEDDNVLVIGVSGDLGSLGYFGYAYYVQNKDKLGLLRIDSGSGCIGPSDETINNSSYSPLSRPLFIYVNNAEVKKDEVYEFIKFYLENGAMLASEGGYVALPPSMYSDGLEEISKYR
jgi:phosphate transport system substrate-binding protein